MLWYGLALTAPVTWGITPLSIYIAPDLSAITATMTNFHSFFSCTDKLYPEIVNTPTFTL